MLSGTSFHCALEYPIIVIQVNCVFAANMDEDVDAKSPVKRIKIQFFICYKSRPLPHNMISTTFVEIIIK